ncbi:MAG: cell wall-binding repeat-containing protein, partial [Coriobacteriia bacterium]
TTQDLLAVTAVNSTTAVAVGRAGTVVLLGATTDTTGPTMTSLASSTHPLETTWYSNNDPAFSWGASDPSGVAGYSYVLDQLLTTTPDTTSEGAATTTSFTDKADGTWYFHVRAVDSLGNWGDTSHLAVKIDTAPPVTTDDHDAVYTAPATITLTPGDTHSGVAATYYALDGTPGTGTTVNTSVAGDHTLEYASVDVAGNRETSVTVDFTIDLTAPSIVSLESSTHPLETTWYANNDPAFSWGASDPGNVAGYSYELGQSASTVPDETSEGTGAMASFTDKADGTWYFHVRAVNAYGTWGSTSHLQVLIDTTSPLTTAEAVTAPGSGTVTLSSFDPDPGSGLAGISWSVADGASGVGNTVTLTGAGTYTVNYWAVDIAGNEETHRSIEVVVPPVVPTELIVTPIAGANRIDTAIIASQEAFPTGATTVVIATGFNWPDALGGAALAGALDAPILLTDPTTLSSAVSVEITRLGASKAVILGGTGAVSTAVENALKSNLGTSNVARVAGANRYETARKIAEATVAEVGAGYDGTAFVATGANFPDALGASPLAAANGWPIYLVDPRGVDSALVASMQSIGVTDAIMLGGTGAVSITIESDLWNDVPCATTRLAGTDRYDTARVVATYGVTDAGLGWDKVAIATGLNFPDALAGGVLQGRTGSVMLLTPGTSLYPGVASTLTANKSEVFEVRFLGGLGAVNQSVRDAVVAALQ